MRRGFATVLHNILNKRIVLYQKIWDIVFRDGEKIFQNCCVNVSKNIINGTNSKWVCCF